MPITELKTKAITLSDAFKKEATPILATAGRGAQPPRMRTAVGMAEPEEDKTPIPFPIWNAFENSRSLNIKADTTFEEADERQFTRLLMMMEPEDLPGLDEVLEKYWINEVPREPISKDKSDRFLLRAYDAGMIKPQNWRQRLTQPIKFALMRARLS